MYVLCNDLKCSPLEFREWLKAQVTVSKKFAIFGRYLNSVPSEFKFETSPLYQTLIVLNACGGIWKEKWGEVYVKF
jgi:hypothetical protein